MNPSVAILAGGLATRLGSLSKQHPKVLLDVAGKPFAVRQIELLKQQGFTEIVFCLGYLGEQVEEVLGDGQQWGVNLQFAYDGPKLLGTGGALRQALPLLSDDFLVMYGDSYLQCDFKSVVAAFRASEKGGLMTVFHNDNQWDSSNVLFSEGRIIKYDKNCRSVDMNYIDYGLGALRSSALQSYAAHQSFDLALVYQNLLAQDELAALEIHQRFYEIGSHRGLQELRDYFSGN